MSFARSGLAPLLAVGLALGFLSLESIGVRAQKRDEPAQSGVPSIKVGGKTTEAKSSQAPTVAEAGDPNPLNLISQALDKRVRFFFRDVPLKEVIEQFELALDIDIRI